MKVYRLTFAKNEIITCREAGKSLMFDGVYHFELDKNGQIIFAIVKAKNEDNAVTMGNLILKSLGKTTMSP